MTADDEAKSWGRGKIRGKGRKYESNIPRQYQKSSVAFGVTGVFIVVVKNATIGINWGDILFLGIVQSLCD